MWAFTIRLPRGPAATQDSARSASEANVLECDNRRSGQAISRLPVALAAWCLAILVIVAYLVSKLAGASGAPVRCFVLRGDAALRACAEVIGAGQPAEVRAEAHYNRGVELDNLGRHAEAVGAYSEAVRLKPDYAAAYTNMGIDLAKLDRWDDAVHAYRAAIQERPEYADAHYNFGLTLAGLRRWADALDAFREAARLDPADTDALYNAGLMLNLLGRHKEALAAYGSTVRIKPDHADAWGNLGLTAYLLGRHSEAAKAFERARMLMPTYFAGRDVQRKAWEESRQRPRLPEHR